MEFKLAGLKITRLFTMLSKIVIFKKTECLSQQNAIKLAKISLREICVFEYDIVILCTTFVVVSRCKLFI
ncbi:protein of unknown function [Legionella longbeachae NSW150]|uniref:Uncharacterized protein n=1 Tax=Legionella longbeachae serogroup 1 (strain NSW150) TaxID=661367 RepID=D3HLN8_LEGLN|nr:protein of unknown function [Legionella longbeachae NSW150]